jgi:putative addiction module component (TIGR02574 family)
MDMTSTFDVVRQWPASDQIEFVQQVWDHVARSGWIPELTETQKHELDRRIAAYDADPEKVLTWEQVEAHLRRRK